MYPATNFPAKEATGFTTKILNVITAAANKLNISRDALCGLFLLKILKLRLQLNNTCLAALSTSSYDSGILLILGLLLLASMFPGLLLSGARIAIFAMFLAVGTRLFNSATICMKNIRKKKKRRSFIQRMIYVDIRTYAPGSGANPVRGRTT